MKGGMLHSMMYVLVQCTGGCCARPAQAAAMELGCRWATDEL
jgi:hypothetical protein